MKSDITISKGVTVSIAPYENVRPNVSITLKDVDVSKINDNYRILEDLVNDIFTLECAMQIDEALAIKRIGVENYADQIADKRDGIKRSIETNSKFLVEIIGNETEDRIDKI